MKSITVTIVLVPTGDRFAKVIKCIKAYENKITGGNMTLNQQDEVGNISTGVIEYASKKYYEFQHTHLISQEKIKIGDRYLRTDLTTGETWICIMKKGLIVDDGIMSISRYKIEASTLAPDMADIPQSIIDEYCDTNGEEPTAVVTIDSKGLMVFSY